MEKAGIQSGNRDRASNPIDQKCTNSDGKTLNENVGRHPNPPFSRRSFENTYLTLISWQAFHTFSGVAGIWIL